MELQPDGVGPEGRARQPRPPDRVRAFHTPPPDRPGGMHGYEESGFFTANVVGQHTPADRLIRFARSALRSIVPTNSP